MLEAVTVYCRCKDIPMDQTPAVMAPAECVEFVYQYDTRSAVWGVLDMNNGLSLSSNQMEEKSRTEI